MWTPSLGEDKVLQMAVILRKQQILLQQIHHRHVTTINSPIRHRHQLLLQKLLQRRGVHGI